MYVENDCVIDENSIPELLNNPQIREIRLFILGPEGTNISKAAHEWANKYNLYSKTTFVFCNSPLEEVEKAKEVEEYGVFSIYVLCAVYNRLYELFFNNLDEYFFIHHHYMKLDNMQLASKKYKTYKEFSELSDLTVLSHKSPSVLMYMLNCNIKCIESLSNSEAAKRCSENEAAACITTQTAAGIYKLNTLKKFVSPVMLFTFGTTKTGIDSLKCILNTTNSDIQR